MQGVLNDECMSSSAVSFKGWQQCVQYSIDLTLFMLKQLTVTGNVVTNYNALLLLH